MDLLLILSTFKVSRIRKVFALFLYTIFQTLNMSSLLCSRIYRMKLCSASGKGQSLLSQLSINNARFSCNMNHGKWKSIVDLLINWTLFVRILNTSECFYKKKIDMFVIFVVSKRTAALMFIQNMQLENLVIWNMHITWHVKDAWKNWVT